MQNQEVENAIKVFKKTAIFTVISLVAAFFALSSATYAWFTSNGEVYSSRVAASTSTADVRLLLSSEGGSAFRGSSEAEIEQVNSANIGKLMPVSTSDLENFVYQVGTDTNSSYGVDTDEKKYYHGHVYVKAECEGTSNYSKMALYLGDVNDMVEAVGDSLVANASRLGLKIGDQDPVIMYMSTEENASYDQVRNTYLNGGKVADDKVIHYTPSGSYIVVDDPAVKMDTFSVDSDMPQRLATIDLNRIYELDVYFYIEGCDPDCSEAIYHDAADIYIPLYGIPEE
jgi:hypothetical protein